MRRKNGRRGKGDILIHPAHEGELFIVGGN